MNRDNLSSMRQSYELNELLENNIAVHPLDQFNAWMKAALEDNLFEPNAMSLATVSKSGQPSCRTVLLKDIIDGGFVFYTNYESKKAKQINENDKIALLFWWREHERQVRIEGKVEQLDWKISNQYYKKRPEGSQIGAKASPQSKVIENRLILDQLYIEAKSKFEKGDNDCPKYWGGYRLIPNLFEFWQGRKNRLHDRIQYKLIENGWKVNRLAP